MPADPVTSERTVLGVVGALALTVLLLGGGLIYLAATKAPSDAIVAISTPLSVALGGLVGMLSSTRSQTAAVAAAQAQAAAPPAPPAPPAVN